MKKVHKRGKVKQTLAAIAFCMALSVGTICSADEGKVTVDAKIRALADASSEQVGSARQGGTVDVISQTTGTDGRNWYQVWINGDNKGYIRADLVDLPEGFVPVTSNAGTNTAAAAESSGTTATPTETRRATVSTNGARIRKSASTSSDIVATANRGMVLTVTGEAAGSDGNTWYQVSFTYNDREITGFIRSDLVSFEDVSPDEATANITGTENEGEGEQPAEEVPQEPPAEENTQASNSSQSIVLMDNGEPPYIMPGFVLVDLNWNDQIIKGWQNGDFIIFYAQVNGDEGWYMMDSNQGDIVYQRYVYGTEGASVPSGSSLSGSILPIAVLAVIIVILLAVIGLMFLRLREYSGEYDDDDEYGDDDDEIEDLEEEDDDDDFTPPPSRRAAPNGRPMQGQPQRRPQPPQQGQPQRRPQPPQQGQPQRRPQPPQQGQPQRRPQPEGDGRVVTKSNGARMANGQGGQVPNRRPAQGQPQQRPKTKNNIENEQDDMDFIDI